MRCRSSYFGRWPVAILVPQLHCEREAPSFYPYMFILNCIHKFAIVFQEVVYSENNWGLLEFSPKFQVVRTFWPEELKWNLGCSSYWSLELLPDQLWQKWFQSPKMPITMIHAPIETLLDRDIRLRVSPHRSRLAILHLKDCLFQGHNCQALSMLRRSEHSYALAVFHCYFILLSFKPWPEKFVPSFGSSLPMPSQ